MAFALFFASNDPPEVVGNWRSTVSSPDRASSQGSAPDQDAALVIAIVEDNAEALREAIRRHAAGLEDYAYTIVRSDDLARDVVQDVFVAFWDHRHQLALRSTLAAYLYASVRHRALSVLRHERVQERLAQTMRSMATNTTASYNTGAAAVEEEEFWTRVDTALASLPPRCREIFLLHRDQGLSYAEIAELFGIGVPTIHVQMSRAVKRIQEYLARE